MTELERLCLVEGPKVVAHPSAKLSYCEIEAIAQRCNGVPVETKNLVGIYTDEQLNVRNPHYQGSPDDAA